MTDLIEIPKLLFEGEAAKALGVSEDTLKRLRKSGKIGYTRIGKRVRYTTAHLAAYIESGSVEPCEDSKPNGSGKSGNTGSVNGPIAPCGAEPGSTGNLDRSAAHRSAQSILSKPS